MYRISPVFVEPLTKTAAGFQNDRDVNNYGSNPAAMRSSMSVFSVESGGYLPGWYLVVTRIENGYKEDMASTRTRLTKCHEMSPSNRTGLPK